MKRIITLLIILCLITTQFAGCASKPAEQLNPSTETSSEDESTTEDSRTEVSTTEAPPVPTTEAPEDTSSETPSENPVEAEAIKLASLHGLSPEDLRGAYDLFLHFSEVVEGNAGLGDYREFVYTIFPAVADGAAYLEENYFFSMLSTLRIERSSISEGIGGQYSGWDNRITLNESTFTDEPYMAPAVLFHELMHFIDFNLNGGHGFVYLLDGKHLHPEETDGLSPEETERLLICKESEIITESGAELWTAKYCSGAPRAYFPLVSFLTGIEYICGEEFVRDMFYRWDTDGVLADLFLEMGYSKQEYYDALDSLNYLTYPEVHGVPAKQVTLEDLLIDLYEHKIGDGWSKDAGFCNILQCINGIGMDDYKHSSRADALREIELTWESYGALETALFDGLQENPDLRTLPPCSFLRGGKLLLGAFAQLTDPKTGTRYHGAITFDVDLANERRTGYETIDFDAVFEQYFR